MNDLNETKEISSKIFEYIDALSIKLEVASTEIFSIYTKQSFVYAFNDILEFFIFSIVVWMCVKLIKYFIHSGNEGKYLDDAGGKFGIYLVVIVLAINSIIFTFCASYNLTAAVGKIVNPEYYALNNIIDQVKK